MAATTSSFLVLPILAPKTSASLFSVKFNAKPISQSFSSALRTSSDKLSARFVRHVAFSSEVDQDDEFLSEGDEEKSFSPDNKLFVGNLPFTVDSEQLAGLFEGAGTVETAEVIYDRETGRSRGFAFVTMSSVEEVKAAAQQFNGYELDGRELRVNYGPPPPKREQSFNRGGRDEGGFNRGPRGGGGPTPNKLYVSNLSWNVDDEALGSFFSEHGNVVEAKVISDYDTGRSRGFGFVTYSSAEEANSAIESLDGADLDGRSIKVAVAESKPRRSFDY